MQSCIDDVVAGRRTPAECARRYPQFPELEADLKTALALRFMQATNLSAEAGQQIEARLRQRVRAMLAADRSNRRQPRPRLGVRWVAGPALAAGLLLAGIGTTAAAGASTPGDLLYGVKRADENVEVFVSPASSRAFVYAASARHRLDEMTVVLQRSVPDAGTVNQLSDDLTAETVQALAFVDAAPASQQASILSALVQMTNEQQTVLSAAQRVAPAATLAGLQRALQASGAGHERAVERLQQVLAVQRPVSSPTATDTATPGASDTATGTITATATTPSTNTADFTQTPTSTLTQPVDETHAPPGQTNIPPGQTRVPPGQTKIPPGQTHVPPGQTHMPSGQTQVPPGQTQVPPGQTHIPPGQERTPKPTKPAGEAGP